MPTTFSLQTLCRPDDKHKYDGVLVKVLTIDLDPTVTEINDELLLDHFCLPRRCVIRIKQQGHVPVRFSAEALAQVQPLAIELEIIGFTA